MSKHTVLIVDDECLIADTLAIIFERAGYASKAVYSAEAVMKSVTCRSPHLAIVDVFLPGMNGFELAHWLRQACPECHILLLSGRDATSDLLDSEAQAGHNWRVLPKPTPPADLLAMAAELLRSFKSKGRSPEHVAA